jgi:hypothetical protein
MFCAFRWHLSTFEYAGKLRPARDWESLNCRLVTQHYKMH